MAEQRGTDIIVKLTISGRNFGGNVPTFLKVAGKQPQVDLLGSLFAFCVEVADFRVRATQFR